MPFTLEINGNQVIQDPTAADISAAVLSLDVKQDAFVILSQADMTYIQATGDKNVGFDTEYQEGDLKHHYQARDPLTAEEVINALVSYMTGSDDWKQAADWELLKL